MGKDINEIEKLKQYIAEILKLVEKLEKEEVNEYVNQCIDTKDIKVISYLDN